MMKKSQIDFHNNNNNNNNNNNLTKNFNEVKKPCIN